MTVASTINRADYDGNGVTTVFPYSFRVFEDADLRVVRYDGGGAETDLTLGVHYSVSGAGSFNGGTVTLLDGPLPVGYSLAIIRTLTLVQGTDLRNQGPFLAETVEDALDRLTMISQQIDDRVTGGVRVNTGDRATVDTELPPKVAGGVPQLNGTGDGFQWYNPVDAGLAAAGNQTVDRFLAGVGFTAGTTAALTLSRSPGNKNATFVTFDGVLQHKSQYSISGTTLTFTSAIPIGTLEVEVMIFNTLAIGIPPDGTDATSFTALPTGATASRTMGERFADAVNVKDFGATGNGVTDDTAAIQAAENIANSRSCSVRFPRGTYLCGSKLYRNGNTVWCGDGAYLSVIKHPGGSATHDMVGVTSEDSTFNNIGFRDLGFDANRRSSSDPAASRHVIIITRNASGGDDNPADAISVEDCYIFNYSVGGIAIHVKGYKRVMVDGCRIEDGGGGLMHPIYIRRCKDVTVSRNIVYGDDLKTNNCIKVEDTSCATITQNIIRNGGNGVLLQDCYTAVVSGNAADGQGLYSYAATIDLLSGNDGITIVGNGSRNSYGCIRLSSSRNASITGNSFVDFSRYGVNVRNGQACVFSGNQFYTDDAGGGQIDFVYFDAGPSPSRALLVGNYLQNSRPGGVTNAFNTNEASPSGMVLSCNRISGTFSSNYTGLISGFETSQITFPATQVPSTDANTLDDYSEGVFTPTVVGSTAAGVGTYNVQVGRYSKIGRRVFFQLRVTWTSHTGTGNLRLDGLPYASNSVANAHSAVDIGLADNIAATAGNLLTGYVPSNSSVILVYQYPTGGGASTVVPMDTAGDLIISGHYEATT
jgi:Pectate lyase superfamily protein